MKQSAAERPDPTTQRKAAIARGAAVIIPQSKNARPCTPDAAAAIACNAALRFTPLAVPSGDKGAVVNAEATPNPKYIV